MAKPKKNQKSDEKKRISFTTKRKRLPPFRHLIAIGLIAGVALLAYSNTFHVPFHFDERPNRIQSPNVQIKVFTWDGAEQSVKNTYGYEFQNKQKAIYPLRTALMLDPLLPNRGEIRRLVRLLEGLP
jgi:hypothetical protein